MRNEFDDFARLVNALRPWQDKLVIVGGWAHRLYRHDPIAGDVGYEPLVTKDADVAFGQRSKLDGSINDALTAAGFVRVLMDKHQPPISEYRLDQDGGEFYAEFLTPLAGGGSRRNGDLDATLERAGITAQKLRHLDVLLVQPMEIQLNAEFSTLVAQPASVRVANPVSFIFQKLLIHDARTADKKAQDILYVHDTIDLFGERLDELRNRWSQGAYSSLSKKEQQSVREAPARIFGYVTDVIRTAASISVARNIDPTRLLKLCVSGLEQLTPA